MKYRKKPVTVEVWRWLGDNNGIPYSMPDWIMKAIDDDIVSSSDGSNLTIKTLEGNHVANVGDYIIQGVKGELYPCKPDIFEAIYEPVE